MNKICLLIVLLFFYSCDNYQSLDPNVKKSSSGICHKKGSQYYQQTERYLSFNTIRECLDSGGRLPR